MYTSTLYENVSTVGPFAVGFAYLKASYMVAQLIDPTGVRPPETVSFTWEGTPSDNYPAGPAIRLTAIPDGRDLRIYKDVSLTLMELLWTKGSPITKQNLHRMYMDLMDKVQKAKDDQASLEALVAEAIVIIEELDLPTLQALLVEIQLAAAQAEGAALTAAAAAQAAQDAVAAITLPIPLASGGTGATDAAGARSALGLGTAAQYNRGSGPFEILGLDSQGKIQDSYLYLPKMRMVDQQFASITVNAAYTAVIPHDLTIPQITEGTQIWSASVDIAAGTTDVLIDISVLMSGISSIVAQLALFVDGGVNAVAADAVAVFAASAMVRGHIRYHVEGLTSGVHTFSLRAGPNTGTLYVNGNQSNVLFGTSEKSNIVISHYVRTT